MSEIKRAFVIVLDSVGAGEAPDAADFGDVGANTLLSLHRTGRLDIPHLVQMGIGNIEGLEFLGRSASHTACVAKLCEHSRGKDTTIGHWELMGHVSHAPLPTFPDGFPNAVVDRIEEISGRRVLCNKPYSGTAVIADYGDEAVQNEAIILYTSADSVLQIAAHTDVVPLDELYRICLATREAFGEGEYAVGRVIARPFEGESGAYVRTAARRDYSLMPPIRLLPEAMRQSGFDTIALGKISDIFAGVGFDSSERTHSNEEGIDLLCKYLKKNFSGLCFLNLVDFDMIYGHRRDARGYADALSYFDSRLPEICGGLRSGDMLVITADHGCDPSFVKSTDHTREYVPLLIYSPDLYPSNFGEVSGFDTLAATLADALGVDFKCKRGTRSLELCYKEKK